jgi:hypothetical protein
MVRRIVIDITPCVDLTKPDKLTYELIGFTTAADAMLALIETQGRIICAQKQAALAAQQAAAGSRKANGHQLEMEANRRGGA